MYLRFIILLTTLFISSLYAELDEQNKRICGEDDRRASSHPGVIRVRAGLGSDSIQTCSAALIGGNCALSAGHCKKILKWAEFNPPLSQNFRPQKAAPENIYQIDQKSIVSVAQKGGDDYAVFKLKKNKITNLKAEQAQGLHFKISSALPQKKDGVQVIGHGSTKDAQSNLTQKEAFGEIKAAVTIRGILWQKNRSFLTYDADTMVGDSGAPVLNEQGDLIGIHARGPCVPFKGLYNSATMIHGHVQLSKAIKACMAH